VSEAPLSAISRSGTGITSTTVKRKKVSTFCVLNSVVFAKADTNRHLKRLVIDFISTSAECRSILKSWVGTCDVTQFVIRSYVTRTLLEASLKTGLIEL
jgi:hypothetical protein